MRKAKERVVKAIDVFWRAAPMHIDETLEEIILKSIPAGSSMLAARGF